MATGLKMSVDIHNMLAQINPSVLPALRIAATFFVIINLIGGTYVFRNRHRFFDRDPNVDDDIAAMRKLRVEVVMLPWLVLTTLLLILLIYLWLA
jgi:disulfide bond formation protein DsbB